MDPDIVFMADRGEYLLVWSEDRGAGSRLYARRIHANGRPVSGPDRGEWEATRLPPNAGAGPLGEQRWPAVIEDLLVYSERQPGGDYDLYGQPLFGNGRPKGAPMLVAGGPGNQAHPSVLAVERGMGVEYLIVWSEDTRDQGDVMGLRVDYALRRSRGPAYAVAQGPGTAEDPTLTNDPLDPRQFLVLFTDDRNGNRDIFGTRLAENGLPRGGPRGGHFPVVESTEDDYAPRLLRGVHGSGPREQSRQLVIWTHDHLTEGPNVMARRLERNGLPRGSAFVVAGGLGVQASPAGGVQPGETTGRRGRPDQHLVVWVDDALGNIDVRGVLMGITGAVRARPNVVAAD